MVLFPLTKVLPLSSSTFKLILPGFINQTIDYTRSLRVFYNLLYLGLLYVSVVYIFSINVFVLQRVNFTKSCSRSRQLGKGHYLHTLLTFLAGGVMLILGMMFFGFVLAEEKEMIYIVVPTRKKDAIMRSVMDQAGIKQEAQAVCFSLPVTDTAGMRLPKDDDE